MKKVIFNFWIDGKEKNELFLIAKMRGVSAGSIIQEFVTKYVRENSITNPPGPKTEKELNYEKTRQHIVDLVEKERIEGIKNQMDKDKEIFDKLGL